MYKKGRKIQKYTRGRTKHFCTGLGHNDQDDSLLSPVHLAVLLIQFQLRLWNPDLITGHATCPRPAIFISLKTAGAVEILSMLGYEKSTDIYS